MIFGFRIWINCSADQARLDCTVSRSPSRKVLIPFLAGLIRSFSLYFRKLKPRKSNPSSICVILVFSMESSRPRSCRNLMIVGCTFCSRISLDTAVQMKSSAYLTKLILSLCLLIAFRAFSRPSNAMLASVGDAIPLVGCRPPFDEKRSCLYSQLLAIVVISIYP